MKTVNIKKLAALATGAVLAGTALAPAVSAAFNLTRSDIYSASGSPSVSIVVGSNAAVSDVVWAGNIAAKIAENATTSGGVSCSVAGTCGDEPTFSDITVDLSVGGTVTYSGGAKQYKIDLNSSTSPELNQKDANALTDAQLSNLTNESKNIKVAGSNSNITVQEKIGIKSNAKMDTSSDVKDLVAYLESGDFVYHLDLGTGVTLDERSDGSNNTYFADSGSTDNVKLPFFGETYELNLADFNSSITNIKFIKSQARETYNEGQVISGLVGRNLYEGQDMTVKLRQITQAGTAVTTFSATFELYDASGSLVDTQTVATGANLASSFVDTDGEEALSSNLFVDTIAIASTTNTGYIEVTKGTDTVELFNGKGYPYDSTDTTGIYDYSVTLTAAAGKFTDVKIQNSREKWNNSASSVGPLYPSNAGQSLTGQTGEQAVFGATLEEGTLGKEYAKVEFQGFEADESRTTITFGQDLSGLDDEAEGGVKYRGFDDSEHTIPFALKMSPDTTGQTFTFDSKTIWYKAFVTDADTNTTLTDNATGSASFVNGREWVVTSSVTATTVAIDGVGTLSDLNAGETFVLDNVVYTLTSGGSGTAGAVPAGTLSFKTNGYVMFRKSNQNGTILTSNAGGDTNTSSPSHGKIYYTDDYVVDTNANNVGSATAAAGPGVVRLEGNGDHDFRYALLVSEDDPAKLWLLLAADTLGEDETTANKIQYSKAIQFIGTAAVGGQGTRDTNLLAIGPGLTVPTPSGVAATTTEGLVKNTDYYVPDDLDYNASKDGIFDNVNAFFVAIFAVDDGLAVSGNDFNVYIDTEDGGLIGSFPNANLTIPTEDVSHWHAPTFNLRTGSSSTYLQGAYTDRGAKVTVDETNDQAVFSIPQNYEQVIYYVLGTDVTQETSGETVTIAEGQTGTLSTGTVVTITDVAVGTAACTGAGGALPTCTVTPSGVNVKATVKNPIVYMDTQSPVGTHIIVGGHVVNSLAAQVSGLADKLTAPGDVVAEVDPSSGDIIVAGYTQDDTGTAAQQLINAIDALG